MKKEEEALRTQTRNAVDCQIVNRGTDESSTTVDAL